jgi:dipeptidase D
MSNDVRNLEPKSLWNHFADLNSVPRPSKKEERVRQFMVDFGKNLNLPTRVDEIGNVIITKPASPGMEHKAPIVMQSHLDMVHQKNASTHFDFDKDGIKMYVDGDWVKADGTTLGADNGIGVATIMAILASNDIDHPAMEALFTIDEETGMTGAQGLKGGELHGKYLLNLDTEDDDELSIGCAGGIDISVSKWYTEEPAPQGMQAFEVHLKGLNGGHSGMDIHKGFGNANKLLNRVLWSGYEKFGMRLSSFDGGGLRNAIPREAFAKVLIAADKVSAFKSHVNGMLDELKKEYGYTDPNLVLEASETALEGGVMPIELQKQLLASIYACPNGIYRMSPDIPDLVQTSNNLARVEVLNGHITVLCLTRSSVDSEKMDLANAIKANFFGLDADVTFSGSYPGWTPLPGSAIVKLMSDLYREMFDGEPNVAACHAGLECGLLGTHYPEMEMISFGPNIRGAHSPDEKVQVSSVQKFWKYTLETLKRIPTN